MAMEFTLTDQENKQKRSFAEFCEKEIKPLAEKTDTAGEIPRSHIELLADAGYLGFGFDEEYGGKGGDLPLWVCLAEHLAASCPSTYAAVNASSHLFGNMVQIYGSDEQKKKYLPGIASGALKAAVALSDLKQGPEGDPGVVLAKVADDGYLLTGVKPYVINGPDCDAVLVRAVVNPGVEDPESALFIVDAGSEGFARKERQSTLGIRGAEVGALEFNKCRADLLGSKDKAQQILDALMVMQNLFWAVFAVGIGQACTDAAISYAGERVIDGKRISKHQEVHFKIAEMHMYTDTARVLARKAAWQVDRGINDDSISRAVKVLATESAAKTAHLALQIHGGKGYMQGEPVERLYRDARLGEIVGETSEVLREKLALAVLDEFRT